MKKTIEQLETERLEWSLKVFTEATPISSLYKAENELQEAIAQYEMSSEGLRFAGERDKLAEEYVDVIMCVFDSSGRAGISVEELRDAFEKKLAKNKARRWVKNPNNTYSHLKSDVIMIDRPESNVKLGDDATCEWFIHYHDPEAHWIKKKILLHADTITEVADSFTQKFPGMIPEKIEYYGLYF